MTLDALTAALADRYLLERELGQGGMATVYLAQDLRHDRKVAIKVLRPELAAVIGAERFVSEIRTTANLQHPHILPLFDSGAAASFLFYVMPLVEGETLRDRITREKHLPIADAVRIAGEVASALDYAHRHGVIHRDIKPENILLHDGRALVADFGIALAASSAGSRMTETGMSLGTPHYMSPEQAMGERELDARTDVYALGAVLYECLTGDPPFTGSTAQAIVAKVVTEKPVPPSRMRDTVPDVVEDAVLAALQKLPADRPSSAAAFGEMLSRDGVATTSRSTAAHRRGRPSRTPWLVAAAVAVVAAVAGWLLRGGLASPPPPQTPSRLALLAPRLGGVSTALMRQLAITPDGSTIYYQVVMENGENRTLRQRLDETEPALFSGAEPFVAGYRISPDGRFLYGVRSTDGSAFRVQLTGSGTSTMISGIVNGAWSSFAAWGDDGSLWLTTPLGTNSQLRRLKPDGTTSEVQADRDNITASQMLGPRTMLVSLVPLGTNNGPVALLDLETGATTPVIETPVVEVRYTSGYLVYVLTSGDMEAMPFDVEAGRTTGPATRIASGVSLTGSGVAQFDVAANGTVVYLPEQPRSLVLLDRSGAERLATSEGHNFHSPRFAPDGRRLAVDYSIGESRDVWVLDLASQLLTRASFDGDGHDASWMPNGLLSYITAPTGVIGILRVRPDGSGEPDSLLRASTLGWTGDWFADGEALLTVANGLNPLSVEDIAIVRNGGAGPLEPLVATSASEQFPALSPDNQWFAYTSNQSGRDEVYLRRVDGTGAQLQVSARGGVEPAWSGTGRELFYRTRDTDPQLMVAELAFTPEPAVRSRTPLFSVAQYATATPHTNYAVSPDGQLFAMVRTNPSARIMVIQNLPALVERLRGEGVVP